MKVLYMTYLPSPYRVEYFSELSKQCELTVLFEKKTANHRDNRWFSRQFDGYNTVVLQDISFSNRWQCIKSHLEDDSYDEVIIHSISTLCGMAAIQYMKTHRIQYWIETDGGFPKSGHGIKEMLKKHLLCGAYGYFSSGQMNDRYLMAYGADTDCIFHYQFTSLRDCDIIDAPLSASDKVNIRQELGILEDNVVISVGRFTFLAGYGKGYDVLMKAAERLHHTGIYIIGDNPTEEFVKMKENMHLDNVHFVGFKNKKQLRRYYQAADLFVLMTISDVWGLVINEAMSNGLPVITTTMCGAGVELVTNEENGYLVEVGDVDGLCHRIKLLSETPQLQEEMAYNSLRKIRKYTYTNSVTSHLNAFINRKNDTETYATCIRQ